MSATPVDLSARESAEVIRNVLGPRVAQGAIERRAPVTAGRSGGRSTVGSLASSTAVPPG